MTTDTLTLADFLLARFAREEAWWRGGGAPARDCQECGALSDHEPDRPTVPRLLADIEAKRRIVEELRAAEDEWVATRGPQEGGEVNGLSRAVELLTAVYADHPDYPDEWRP